MSGSRELQLGLRPVKLLFLKAGKRGKLKNKLTNPDVLVVSTLLPTLSRNRRIELSKRGIPCGSSENKGNGYQ